MKRKGSTLVRLIWLLLATTGVFIVTVAAHVVSASQEMSVRPGLDYRDFLAALDELIRGAGESALVEFAVVEERLPSGASITYDTLVIVADRASYPAFQRAGFLYDQVMAYNRFQRERADLARTQPEWFDRLQAHNPSVFRSYRSPEGPRLTRSAAAWSLRVRSPAEEEWSGEIRSRDVERITGLLGPRVTVPLNRPVRLTRRVDGRRQLCEFLPSGLEVRVYCLSEERIPQAVFRMAADGRSPESARAGWTDLWVDGTRVPAGDSIPLRTGSVVRIRPLAPVVFGEYWEGVLSSKQWISGRMRRRSEFAPPLDLFSPLGNRASVATASTAETASVDISIDAGASMDLTERLQAFLTDAVPLDIDFGIIVIGRISDGEIMAIAEVGNRRSRGRSNLLQRITPGSAVKPLIAAAVLSQRPELASLKIPARSGAVRSVLGMPRVPSNRAFRTTLNCPAPSDGWIDLTYFLRCSNNEYAAALVTAGLWDGEGMIRSEINGSGFVLNGQRVRRQRLDIPLVGLEVSRATLLRSALSEGLSELFDVPTDPAIADAVGRSRRAWQGLTFSDGSVVQVPFELLATESRPALLAPSHPEGTDLGLLYRYAFGAWENGWNLIDLTTGFGRVVTDSRLQLRFVRQRDARVGEAGAAQRDGAESLGLGSHDWYQAFLTGLRGVAVDGTASGLRDSWARRGLPSSLFVKTGTLAEPGGPGNADDLFIKSMLFAVGEEDDSAAGALECGLVGGIYFRFEQGPRRGSLPSYQVEFAREELGDFLEDNWDTFGACEEGDGGRTATG